MLDRHYVIDRMTALYDIECGWSADRDFYLELAGREPIDVLDLGCGTGLLCDAYAARGHRVTGADPAAAMLAVARRKPHGTAIDWVEAPAEAFASERRFDLIIMTGHAFQVLLEDAQVVAFAAVLRRHLKPGGRAVFESRNPAIDWAGRWRLTESRIETPEGAVEKTTSVLARNADRLRFEQRYHFADGEVLASVSELRFLSAEAIFAHAAAAGLKAGPVLGDWYGSAFQRDRSDEMIFTLGHA